MSHRSRSGYAADSQIDRQACALPMTHQNSRRPPVRHASSRPRCTLFYAPFALCSPRAALMPIIKEIERSPLALREFIVKGNEYKAAGLRGPPRNITLPCLLALQLRCVVSRFSLKSPPNAPLTYTLIHGSRFLIRSDTSAARVISGPLLTRTNLGGQQDGCACACAAVCSPHFTRDATPLRCERDGYYCASLGHRRVIFSSRLWG